MAFGVRNETVRTGWQVGVVLLKKLLKLVALAALFSGCSTSAEAPKNFDIQLNPTVEPLPSTIRLPLTVGVYYDPKFRSTRYQFRGFTGLANFPVGQASVTLFDRLFAAIFKSVSVVPDRPPLRAEGAKIDAVIEPAIAAFDVKTRVRGPGFTETYRAEITYRFTLWSSQGERIASWTVTGNGETRGVTWRADELRGRVAELAMRDAAAKFLRVFRGVPEARRWLGEMGLDSTMGIQE